MSHLYIIEIGGVSGDSLFEQHVVHAMVAPDERSMIEACHTRFAPSFEAAHIDGWVAIAVDSEDRGHAFKPASRCWLLEMGRNSQAFLREQHDYRFLQAPSAREAIATLRKEMPGWHIDSVVDVDRLAHERGWRLTRSEADALPDMCQVARYIRFDRMAPALPLLEAMGGVSKD
jgi:hypothetical protein